MVKISFHSHLNFRIVMFYYVDSSTKLDDKQQPKKEDFYSHLKEEDITEDDYIYAQ